MTCNNLTQSNTSSELSQTWYVDHRIELKVEPIFRLNADFRKHARVEWSAKLGYLIIYNNLIGTKACVRYEIKFDLSNSSLSSGPPSLVELRSSEGTAGEYKGSKMGVYQLLPDGGEGGSPVYRQLHDGDNEQYYLYRWGFSCTTDVMQLNAIGNWIKYICSTSFLFL